MADFTHPIDPVIVLKFGGSVLLDENRLSLCVHEIYRWRRDGYLVVAVVSALAGETEALIERCHEISECATPHARAALIGQGEATSAALLGLLLDRSGIPASVLTPAGIDLCCTGDALNAYPIAVNMAKIHRALEMNGVVIVPGFVGVDEHGRSVTLGRGGSDSTAVFLAGKLDASRCCLIKDVDGLYESDPARKVSPPPQRYANVSFDDALQTDGSIIQHKSIRLAQSLGVNIELGRLNAELPSIIGEHETTYSPHPDRSPRLKLGICGIGTVGGGLVRQLQTLTDDFEIVGVVCRTPEKYPDLAPLIGEITTDLGALTGSEADVILELIGGVEPARTVVETALRNGKHVITANKALIAEHGSELLRVADEYGVHLLYSASVGGGLPVLERLRGCDVVSVSGVLNGTSQFVLHSVARGVPYEQAISQAQRLGYAEADPSRDLDGRDALDKLRVIALQLGWSRCKIDAPACDPSAVQPGAGVVCQIGRISPMLARVSLEQIEDSSPYASLGPSDNRIEIELANGQRLVIHGKGAGRWPTCESVLADLLWLNRSLSVSSAQAVHGHEEVACA